MTVKELVLDIKNKPGELSRIISHLHDNDVKVPAFWVGGTSKKATLRFVASDPEAAVSVLTGMGSKVKTADVIAAQVPNHPGGLNSMLKVLQGAGINILHLYPFFQAEDSVVILDVDRTDDAVAVLKDNWINMYDDKVYAL
jgi:hypothetical protein